MTKPTSPYKKFKTKNEVYEMYINMNKLQPNKPYKIYDIKSSDHPTYGPGQRAYIMDHNNQRFKVQIPKKYMSLLTLPDDIDLFLADIGKGNNPYIVYREMLPNNSYRIDIIPGTPETNHKFKHWLDIDELENSVSSNDSLTESKESKDS